MVDNCIPYIGGEEEKSEQEPLKLWGRVENGRIVKAEGPAITAQCFRVACQDGHMAAVFMKFKDGCKPSMEQIKTDWAAFRGPAQELQLPSAPKQFLHYFEEPDRPQTRLDRMLERGMAVSLGRLREDTQYDYKFVGLSHNTLRAQMAIFSRCKGNQLNCTQADAKAGIRFFMLKREVFCCEGDSLYRFWCGHCDAVSRRGGEFSRLWAAH